MNPLSFFCRRYRCDHLTKTILSNCEKKRHPSTARRERKRSSGNLRLPFGCCLTLFMIVATIPGLLAQTVKLKEIANASSHNSQISAGDLYGDLSYSSNGSMVSIPIHIHLRSLGRLLLCTERTSSNVWPFTSGQQQAPTGVLVPRYIHRENEVCLSQYNWLMPTLPFMGLSDGSTQAILDMEQDSFLEISSNSLRSLPRQVLLQTAWIRLLHVNKMTLLPYELKYMGTREEFVRSDQVITVRYDLYSSDAGTTYPTSVSISAGANLVHLKITSATFIR